MTQTLEPHWLNRSQQRSWRGLVVGVQLLMDRLDADLRGEFNISYTEYEILVRLSERPDRSIRMAHLAAALAHSRSRVTHTIDRMEKAGLVVRDQCTEDGRGVIARLTPQGARLLVDAAPLHVAGVRAHLVEVADPDDFEALGRVMNAVADHLIDANPEAEIRSRG